MYTVIIKNKIRKFSLEEKILKLKKRNYKNAEKILKKSKQEIKYLSNDFLMNSATCTSPSKAFNIAGLQIANITVADNNIKKRIENNYLKHS